MPGDRHVPLPQRLARSLTTRDSGRRLAEIMTRTQKRADVRGARPRRVRERRRQSRTAGTQAIRCAKKFPDIVAELKQHHDRVAGVEVVGVPVRFYRTRNIGAT